MESIFWGKMMKIKSPLITLIALLTLTGVSYGQPNKVFYNIDKEITVLGSVKEIILEPRYKNTAPFLIVKLEEKNTQTIYTVEVSPVWFFDKDIHKGETLQAVGSLSKRGSNNLLVARTVKFKGKMFVVRDKHGFPNWSRRSGRRKGWRKR